MTDDATLRAKQSIRGALLVAGGMLAGTVLLTIAHKVFGWIDNESTTRGVMVLIGLMLVATGNGMPKKQEGPPSQTLGEVVVRQSVTRVGGWALLLGGLAWTALWLFAPRDIAQAGSISAVAIAVIVMLAYTVWRYRAHRRSQS